jgi:hypothetical protein
MLILPISSAENSGGRGSGFAGAGMPFDAGGSAANTGVATGAERTITSAIVPPAIATALRGGIMGLTQTTDGMSTTIRDQPEIRMSILPLQQDSPSGTIPPNRDAGLRRTA